MSLGIHDGKSENVKTLVFSTHLTSELREFTCTEHLLSLKEQACVKYIGICHHLIAVP